MEKVHKTISIIKLQVLTRPLIIGLILVIAIGGWFWYNSQKPNSEVRTAKVVRQNLTETITASGEVTADKQVELRFSAPAQIVWMGVKEGDTVRAGQALASLDKRQVEDNLKKKLLAYMNERWDFEQVHDDYNIDGKQLTEVPLTDKEKRILEKAQFDLNSTVLDVEIANLAIEESTVISPISGTVTTVSGLNAGEQLTAAQLSTSFFRVVDFKSLVFEATVDEVDFSKITVGQNVNITLDAFPDEEFPGSVIYVGREGKKTITGGVVVPVKIALTSGMDKLVTGLSGDAEFVIAQKENVLVVPREFVKNDGTTSYVMVRQSDDKITKIPVTTGLTTIASEEITGDIQEGQEVILQNYGEK
jgi:RND family efflux transporter MFP subunit